jgi:hypothetical protein
MGEQGSPQRADKEGRRAARGTKKERTKTNIKKKKPIT